MTDQPEFGLCLSENPHMSQDRKQARTFEGVRTKLLLDSFLKRLGDCFGKVPQPIPQTIAYAGRCQKDPRNTSGLSKNPGFNFKA